MKAAAIHTTVKKILFVGVLFLLFIPMVQQKMKFVELEPLKGSFTTAENPYFSKAGWLDASYQQKQEAYLNEQFGFRSSFVRLYNQMYYSLYKQAKANGVIVGKDKYLYELNHINAHMGLDFKGHEHIRNKVYKLARLRDILRDKGKDLIVVFAPGKASFYPEYLPDEYNPKLADTSNYEVYCEELAKTPIYFLDFHRWFRQMKTTAPYPLVPKTGIHWSSYGEVLAADSLTRFINSIRSDDMVAEIQIDKLESSLVMRSTDDDIEKGMNLLFDIPDLEMGYPHFRMIPREGTTSTKVLTVADSYFWGMFNWGLSRDAFNDGQFWYYNRQIYPDSYTEQLNVQDIDIRAEVEKNDVVVLMATDANLNWFAFDFIDQLYDSYVLSDKLLLERMKLKEEKIQSYIQAIKETPEWYQNIKEQAWVTKTPLEEALRKNAEYMVWKEEQEQKNPDQ